jgi:hypothetical protein
MLPDALKCTKMTVFGPELSPELDWNRSHTEDSAEPIQLDLRDSVARPFFRSVVGGGCSRDSQPDYVGFSPMK